MKKPYLVLLLFAFIGTCFSNENTDDMLPSSIIGNAGPLQGEAVNYFTSNKLTQGYLAIPEGPGPHPSVILIHEWNGLAQRVKETADSLAKEGYIALAADLYSGRVGHNREENMQLVQETLAQPDILIANLNAAVQMLKERDDSNGKVATIGWCYGGGVALSFAMGGEHHDGTAIFYGRLLDDPERLKHVDHGFYGTFARNDQGIPVEDVEQFVKTLNAAGISNDIHIYDAVSHGFWLHVDRNPKINLSPAIDAWIRLKSFLKSNLSI
jgi:carboxymethylenebutenolidase